MFKVWLGTNKCQYADLFSACAHPQDSLQWWFDVTSNVVTCLFSNLTTLPAAKFLRPRGQAQYIVDRRDHKCSALTCFHEILLPSGPRVVAPTFLASPQRAWLRGHVAQTSSRIEILEPLNLLETQWMIGYLNSLLILAKSWLREAVRD